MVERSRVGYKWKLRQMMAKRNLWKSTDLMPLLKARGISLSETQVWRLVTGSPQLIPARTFSALCYILDCTPNDLFEPVIEMESVRRINAPAVGEDPMSDQPTNITHRVRLVEDDE